MNSESTKHGPYEYDRNKLKECVDSRWGEQQIDSNAELNDFLHRQQGQPYDRNSDLIGVPYEMARCEDCGEFHAYVYCRDKILRICPYLNECPECRDREEWLKADRKTSRQALVVLILVFAGVVLWKVWIGS